VRTLVIESATEACSAALFEGGALLAGSHEVLGRGHAERLVPMISELPENGERIVVSLGPGSFTGVRIGLAVARALGLAWQAEVLGYPTLALVAAMAQAGGAEYVTVCMSGGHGEWFVQDYDLNVVAAEKVASLTPTQAFNHGCYCDVVGTKSRELAESQLDDAMFSWRHMLPDAREFLSLPESLLTADLAPLYGRPPDARLPSA
jgi:tRNA threonylcarbamoyl adenosine modification protein YeaZ